MKLNWSQIEISILPVRELCFWSGFDVDAYFVVIGIVAITIPCHDAIVTEAATPAVQAMLPEHVSRGDVEDLLAHLSNGDTEGAVQAMMQSR